MKSTIIAMSIALASTGIAAESALEGCAKVATMANEMMSSRQSGVPMAQVMTAYTFPNDNQEEDGKKMYEDMVIDAYSRRRAHTDHNQRRMVEDFENDIYLSCIRVLRGQAQNAKPELNDQ